MGGIDEQSYTCNATGKKLNKDCYLANSSKNELPGVDGCCGLTDYNPGIYNDECKECGALVWNITQEAVDRIRAKRGWS